MPRPSEIPNYTHHKASGQAVVRILGKVITSAGMARM